MIGKQARKKVKNGAYLINENQVAHHIKFTKHMSDTILIDNNNTLYAFIKLAGIGFETVGDKEIETKKLARNRLYQTLSTETGFYYQVFRKRIKHINNVEYETPFIDQLNRAYTNRFNESLLFRNDHYICIIRKDPFNRRGGNLFKRMVRDQESRRERVRAFEAEIARFEKRFKTYEPKILSLYEHDRQVYSEPLEYLSYLLNGREKKVLAPRLNINEYLPESALFVGESEIQLVNTKNESTFCAMLSVKEYVPETKPNMMIDMLELPNEYIVTHSFFPKRRSAAISAINRELKRKVSADDKAASQLEELGEAMDDVESRRMTMGKHHMTIMARERTLDLLRDTVDNIDDVLSGQVGLQLHRERGLALEPSFWSQLPCNWDYIIRDVPVSSLNMASFASMHDYPSGKAKGNEWGDCITYLKTDSKTPVAFNFHYRDLANFLVFGPSGYGKTVFLNFMAAMCEKYNVWTTIIDKDRGAEIFVRAIGGSYVRLVKGRPSGLNPLQLPDTPENRDFLIELLTACCEMVYSSPLTLSDSEALKVGIDRIFTFDRQDRRLGNVINIFKGHRAEDELSIYNRLKQWCETDHYKGQYAWIFDNPEDQVQIDQRYIGFDCTEVLGNKTISTPIMLYMFHIMDMRKKHGRTLNLLDELWRALESEQFESKIKDEEKTIRKQKGLVGLVTQDIADVANSNITEAIVNQTKTMIFFYDPTATVEHYKKFKLTDKEIETIQTLGDDVGRFLYKHGETSTVAQLDLHGMKEFINVLSATNPRLERMEAMISEHGDDWLEHYMLNEKEVTTHAH